MSELTQFPKAPKRPRDAPGSDGYVLQIQPGFAEEQKCYSLRVTLPAVATPTSTSNTVNINFPHIKLGAGNYVLDIERVVCTYTAATNINDITTNGTYVATLDGIGHTLTCSSTNVCTTDMRYTYFFGNGSVYRPTTTQAVVTYSRVFDVMNQHTYALPIEKDTLNLTFTVNDQDNYFVNTGGNPGAVTCVKEFFMVVRPNPAKFRYFDA